MKNMKGVLFLSFVCLEFFIFNYFATLFPGRKLNKVTSGPGGEEEPELFPSVGQSDGEGGNPEITAGWLRPAYRGRR